MAGRSFATFGRSSLALESRWLMRVRPAFVDGTSCSRHRPDRRGAMAQMAGTGAAKETVSLFDKTNAFGELKTGFPHISREISLNNWTC